MGDNAGAPTVSLRIQNSIHGLVSLRLYLGPLSDSSTWSPRRRCRDNCIMKRYKRVRSDKGMRWPNQPVASSFSPVAKEQKITIFPLERANSTIALSTVHQGLISVRIFRNVERRISLRGQRKVTVQNFMVKVTVLQTYLELYQHGSDHLLKLF